MFFTYLILCIAVLFSSAVYAAEEKHISIGTAGIGGGYYPTGEFICGSVNKNRKNYGHNIHCSVESTGGSVDNLRSIQEGKMSVGMAQADWQYHSVNGTGKFEKDGKNEKLRFLFSLHLDTAHMVSKKELNARNFKDLKGKAVNIGKEGSGAEATVRFALNQYNSTPEKYFGQVSKLSSSEQAAALCSGKIDAYFYTTAIGAAAITDASNTCDVSVVNWMDPEIINMIKNIPYYGVSIIPAKTYRGQEKEIKTWGLPATIVASADTDEEIIYYLVKSVFDDFQGFQSQSPMYVGLLPVHAVYNGRTAPYHSGAKKYFKEIGLLK